MVLQLIISLTNGDFDSNNRFVARLEIKELSPDSSLFVLENVQLPPCQKVKSSLNKFRSLFDGHLKLNQSKEGRGSKEKSKPDLSSKILIETRPKDDELSPKLINGLKQSNELKQSKEDFEKNLNDWLNNCPDGTWQNLLNQMRTHLNRSDQIRVYINTNDETLRKIPWSAWTFFDDYNAEIALSPSSYQAATRPQTKSSKVRILVVLGADNINGQNRVNINFGETQLIDCDNKTLTEVLTERGGEIKILKQPTEEEFRQYLQDKKGWDIFCFFGHSYLEDNLDEGAIVLNDQQKVKIRYLTNALQDAYKNGLKIAFFNCCESLVLANTLASSGLNIPQVIVTRQLVPAIVGQQFLEDFFKEFSANNSPYSAVRQARRNLQRFEERYPGIQWILLICQNPAEPVTSWNELRRIGDIDWEDVCRKVFTQQQENNRLRKKITEGGYELNVYVALGLLERKQQQRRRGEIQEEQQRLNGQTMDNPYQVEPEVVTKEYEHDEFLEQVIGDNQDKNIAIAGEPGAGKTTLLDKIASWILAKNKGLPICIPLGDLRGKDLKKYILEDWLNQALPFIDENVHKVTPEMVVSLIKRFREGGMWLLLDGLDEMAVQGQLIDIQQYLSCEWFEKARVVLTSRLNVWDAKINNPLDKFQTYRTLEFSVEQIDEFIEAWFKVAASSQNEPQLTEKAKTLQDELKQGEYRGTQELVKNPLRLSLLCQTWMLKSNSAKLPDTKAGLYEGFIDYISNEWKQPKNLEDLIDAEKIKLINELNIALGELAKSGIDSKYRFRLPQNLCIDIDVVENESSIAKRKNISLFQLACDLGWLNIVNRDERDNKPVYAFFHPTFQEYFAARAISDWGYFLPREHINKPIEEKKYRIFEPEWKEVYLFWMGRQDKEGLDQQKEELIDKLINFDSGC